MPTTNADVHPTYRHCVEVVVRAHVEPITIDQLLEEIGRLRPITKGARSAVGRAVAENFQIVPLPGRRVAWLPALLQGSMVRHTLAKEELRGNFLYLDELEHVVFFPLFFQNLEDNGRELQIDLFGDESIAAQLTARDEVWALALPPRFSEWLDRAGAQRDDDLLITVVDAGAGHYGFRLQPVEARQEEEIKRRNDGVAQAAEAIAQEVLCRQPLFTWDLIARLIGQGLFSEPTPPDDLHYVLEVYSRLRLKEDAGYELRLLEPYPDLPTVPTPRTPVEPHLAGIRQSQPPAGRPSRPATRAETAQDDEAGSRTFGRRIVFGPSRPIFSQQGDAMTNPFEGGELGDESCEAYEEYLVAWKEARRRGTPLSHDDYHLLEAELELLVDLELEFGYLLADQSARKLDLAERLFIDPESLVESSWDEGEDLDGDGPILWN